MSDIDENWHCETEPLVNLFSFGWTEDGRCGYINAGKESVQSCPRPVASLRGNPKNKFVVRKVAAGSRHSLIIMIDTSDEVVQTKSNNEDDSEEEEERKKTKRVRKKKLLITGLSQVALCEEPGNETVAEVVDYDCDADPPVHIAAGHGTSYIITTDDHVLSFGAGHYGVLGQGNTDSYTIPRRIPSLSRCVVTKIATGGHHAIALSQDNVLYSWGRNHKGQLGRGFESEYEATPSLVPFGTITKYKLMDVACGQEHSIAWVTLNANSEKSLDTMFCWGDESRGQLGSGDVEKRSQPQENRWFTKFIRKNLVSVSMIAAGGYHNLVLTRQSGQVMSWGGNEYGQLGHGNQWDDATPRFINNLKDVYTISAGLRHSLAVCDSHTTDVMAWGFNGYGECGVGDTEIRLQPTKITGFKKARVLQVSCGERHSMVVTSHIPITAKEDTTLKPYFKILEGEKGNKMIEKRLKYAMNKAGLDPTLIDDPDAIIPNQAGSSDAALKNDTFDGGLRYCMDTKSDKFDWRRKALETCYECNLKNMHLKSVCLSCARNCLGSYRLRPIIRARKTGDKCDCIKSGLCVSRWNMLRAHFDKFCDDDKNIGPKDIRAVLKSIRAPYPIDNADVEDALICLAEGSPESARKPRIKPVPFEKWYRRFYDEKDDDAQDTDDDDDDGDDSNNNNNTKVKGLKEEGRKTTSDQETTSSTARTDYSTSNSSMLTTMTGRTGYTDSSWQVIDVVKSN